MIEAITPVLTVTKSLIDIAESAKDLLPNGKDKTNLEKQLASVEKELEIAKANSAKELGYDLCKCTFPPRIMLYKKDRDISGRRFANTTLAKAR